MTPAFRHRSVATLAAILCFASLPSAAADKPAAIPKTVADAVAEGLRAVLVTRIEHDASGAARAAHAVVRPEAADREALRAGRTSDFGPTSRNGTNRA